MTDHNQQENSSQAELPAASQVAISSSHRDKIIKWGFVVAVLLAGVFVYLLQTRDLSISGWGNDLQRALDKAREENRPVVALFVDKPPSATALEIKKHILRPANQTAIEEGHFIPVVVNTSSGSALAERYRIDTFPTLMVLRSDGIERNRAEGNVGEVPFRQQFLDYKED